MRVTHDPYWATDDELPPDEEPVGEDEPCASHRSVVYGIDVAVAALEYSKGKVNEATGVETPSNEDVVLATVAFALNGL